MRRSRFEAGEVAPKCFGVKFARFPIARSIIVERNARTRPTSRSKWGQHPQHGFPTLQGIGYPERSGIVVEHLARAGGERGADKWSPEHGVMRERDVTGQTFGPLDVVPM
jgi:hypothetical protein